MVKPDERRFGDHLLWGDGWGWAYFGPGATEDTSTGNYAQECKTCHIPAQATDWVFVQGYPVLK